MTQDRYEEICKAEQEMAEIRRQYLYQMEVENSAYYYMQAHANDPLASQQAKDYSRQVWEEAVDELATLAIQLGEEPGQCRRVEKSALTDTTTTTTSEAAEGGAHWRNRGEALRNIAEKYGPNAARKHAKKSGNARL